MPIAISAANAGMIAILRARASKTAGPEETSSGHETDKRP